MKNKELIAALKFGKDIVAECKKAEKPVPVFVYERIIELQEELIDWLRRNVWEK